MMIRFIPGAAIVWRTLIAGVVLSLCFLGVAHAKDERQALTEALQAEVAKAFPGGEPGAAVIVVKDGKVILREAGGMANLELGVKVEPQMVFRIGSVTKQFTAVAILMLMEQGKLSLTDDVTRFLPDYPTHGARITIEQLLTHTSGISSYTDSPDFLRRQREDLTLTELIGLFKDKPLDFTPGERWYYDNSGYVLLGAIIEIASGESYADFLAQHIFRPLEMSNTRFEKTTDLISGRVPGYTKTKHGFRNADYISMTLPYAAGSLASTVDDLALWDAALYTERLVSQSSLRRAWTSFHLDDGTDTHYGYGWSIGTLEGLPTISHAGGVNGFSCLTVRIPSSHVYAAVLTNRDNGNSSIARKLAVLASGAEWHDAAIVSVPAPALKQLTGSYRLDASTTISVSLEDGVLFVDLPRYGRLSLAPISELEFAFNADLVARLIFQRAPTGAVTKLTVKSGIGPYQVAVREAESISSAFQ